MSVITPPARFIDPRGQRFGAAVSSAILLVAFALGLPWLATLVGLNLAIAAAFGSRFFLPGRPWPLIRRVLRLGPTELEHEYPPRFAQALGATFVALGTLLFLLGATAPGWLVVGAVAGLQVLLAAAGICVGCRLYVLRWWVPAQFTRFARRTDSLVRVAAAGPLRRPDA